MPEYGSFTGDVAWGGNWFFLVTRAPCELTTANRSELIATSMAIRAALHANGVTGHEGAYIDHIEFFSAPMDPAELVAKLCPLPGCLVRSISMRDRDQRQDGVSVRRDGKTGSGGHLAAGGYPWNRVPGFGSAKAVTDR